MKNNHSEQWSSIPWHKLKKNLFRLQRRVWKAIRAGNRKQALNLMKLIVRSRSARLIAIRQVTQLNQGKKTAGIDGKKSLSPKQRFDLEKTLAKDATNWKHQGLKEIPIPKKDGSTRILKVPTIADRAWQCLIKLAIEPAHEAIFHPRSYGFRTGRATHDAQKFIFQNLNSQANGTTKRVLELDISKCFDRINHNTLMEKVIAPQFIKQGIWRCLKAGNDPNFPEQGTPQGGVVSPLLANIALDGIENIHKSARYADDMVFILKPEDNAKEIQAEIEAFLAQRGLNINPSKTRLVNATDGFDFLGWNFKVQQNGKFRCTPSEENYQAFVKKVKEIAESSNYGAKVKAKKLAPIIRGWRNYHQNCRMEGKYNLWFLNQRTFLAFRKDKKLSNKEARNLVKKAFPRVAYKENGHIMVKGDKTPYDGDLIYWSKRNSKLYFGDTAKAMKRQNHKCDYCGLIFTPEEKVHLHHVDGNHDNWKHNNLVAIHESCHKYLHTSKKS